MEQIDFTQLLVQGGALALLAVLCYLFVTAIIPKVIDFLNAQRIDFISALHDRDEKFERTLIKIQDSHSNVISTLSDKLSENTQALNNVCRHDRERR